MTTAHAAPRLDGLVNRVIAGVIGGLVGGVVFGVLMQMMGMIGMVARAAIANAHLHPMVSPTSGTAAPDSSVANGPSARKRSGFVMLRKILTLTRILQ